MSFASTADTLPSLDLIGRVLSLDARGTLGGRPMLAGADVIDWPLVVALASHHLVTPALHPRFGEAGLAAHLDQELQQYFQTITELNRNRNLRIYAQLVEVTGLLNEVGARPIFLKGTAHLVLGLYREVADRVIGDIDLLVAAEEFDKTINVLTEAGYVSLKGHAEHAHHHHYPPLARDDSEACVEVHKDAPAPLYARALPTETMIQQAKAIQIEGKQAAIPCPDDLLVHNIVHSQLSNRGFWSAEFSLRDAYDLVLLAGRFRDEIDWDQLAARLTEDVGMNCAGFYVRRAHLLFGQTPPPIPWPFGARVTDRRWTLHASGRLIWLQPLTRLSAYASQALSRIIASPDKRRRSLRRLSTSDWYESQAGRLRAFTGTSWSRRDRFD